MNLSKIVTAIITFSLFAVAWGYATTPNSGGVSEGVYHSTFFNFSVPLPNGAVLVAVPEKNTNFLKLNATSVSAAQLQATKQGEDLRSFSLLAANQSPPDLSAGKRWTVTASAENISVHPEIEKGEDYLPIFCQRLTSAGKKFTLTRASGPFLAGGVSFCDFVIRDDLVTPPIFNRWLVTVRHQYVILFGIVATDKSNLNVWDEGLSKLTFKENADDNIFPVPPVSPADEVDKKTIRQTMEKLDASYEAGNFAYALDVMYQPALELVGGKDKDLAAVSTLMSQMKDQQMSVISWKSKPPSFITTQAYTFTLFNSTNVSHKYAIIHYDAIMMEAGKRLHEKGWQFGVKLPDATWQFINGGNTPPQVFKQLFPDFPKETRLPKVERFYE